MEPRAMPESTMKSTRPLAIVTGASSGIGLALASEAGCRAYEVLAEQHRKMAEPGSARR